MRVYISKRKVAEPTKKGVRPTKQKWRKPGRAVLEEIEHNVIDDRSSRDTTKDEASGSKDEGLGPKERGLKRKRGQGDQTPKAPNRGKKTPEATLVVTPKAVLEQMAYYKEVDEFLLEEEVASGED